MPHHVPARGFDAAEFEARTQRAQADMATSGLAGLLLMTEPEVRYFTGFQTQFWQSPTRPWFVHVPASGKPVAVIPEIGARLMRRGWLDDIRTWHAPAPDDDGISLLIELLTPLAGHRQRLGVLKGHETLLRMPLGDWERLLAALPGLQVVDATSLVQGLRMTKSPAEIDKIAHACSIASSVFDDMPAMASIGQSLESVFRAFRGASIGDGADDIPYLAGAAGPGGYGDVISPPTDQPLREGDVLMLDTGLTWDGYFCDFDRNWSLGPAGDQARRAHELLWRATEAGMEMARPGNRCSDVFHAISATISGMDETGGSVGRFGHGLGMQLTEQPSIAAFDDTVLTEGMVLTIEPSMACGPGLMMVHEEDIVVGPDGARLLTTRTATELPVI